MKDDCLGFGGFKVHRTDPTQRCGWMQAVVFNASTRRRGPAAALLRKSCRQSFVIYSLFLVRLGHRMCQLTESETSM